MAKETKSYTIKVVGESESPFRGAVPEDTKILIGKPKANVAELTFQIVKTQVELLLQTGDTAAAWETLKKYQDTDKEKEYNNPLNCFKRDHQNGNWPYQGAHTVYGAFRDGSRFIFPEFFYEKGVTGGTKRPSKTHLRKFIKILPNHIFFQRNGDVVTKPDGIHGQQPTPDVKGFARYEYVNDPFQFEFKLTVNPKGLYEKFLSNQDKVMEGLRQGVNHGLGASRSAGYGMWHIVSTEIV